MSIMQMLFGGKKEELIGLDISSSAVKLLELSRLGDRYRVESFAAEPLPAGAVNEKQIADVRQVGDAISRALKRAGTRTRSVAVAVAGSAVITKVVQLPSSLSDHDMEEQIKAQADQYIPFPIDDVNLDFQVLNARSTQAGDRGGTYGDCDVLLAACRKEQVESRCAAAELAGLVPRVVDIEAYAMENACMFLQHQMPARGVGKTVAIVDAGASTTSLLVLHDQKTVYTRDQNFGGRQLTEEIMRQFGMGFEDAGKAKKFGNLPERYEAEILPDFIADLGQQIDRSLQFFLAASSQHNTIDLLILAGGCAQIPGVDGYVQQRLGIPTVVARPFAAMSIAARARPSVLAKDEAALLIAAGLASRAFDAGS